VRGLANANEKRGYTKGWRGCGQARGKDFCGRNMIFKFPNDRSKNRDSPKNIKGRIKPSLYNKRINTGLFRFGNGNITHIRNYFLAI